jgi:hypothetical protein
MSKTYDRVIGEYDELERQATELLEAEDPDGTDRKLALTRHLRDTLRRNRGALAKVREETRAQVLAEMAAARKTEAQWRNAGVPEVA